MSSSRRRIHPIGLLIVLTLAAIASTPAAWASPTACFTWSCSGLTCTLDASCSTGSITSYFWYFSAEMTWGSGQTIVHTFPSHGSFLVDLIVVDSSNNTSSVAQLVTTQ